MGNRRPVVHLMDGHIYIFRSYFSLPEMISPDGVPVNAAYGFANTLIQYLTLNTPTHMAIAFDHSLGTFRSEMDADYKANRPEAPEDLEPQFEICNQVASALGFTVYEKPGYEADDLLATLAKQLVSRGADVVIVTADKDLSQLVREDGRIVLYDFARDLHMDADVVREKFGVSPKQIPDYLGLVGDAIDNIPGVPGVGAKSASILLNEFETIDKIPSAEKEWEGLSLRGRSRIFRQLEENRERALLSRKLATVLHQVPGIRATLREVSYRGAMEREFQELAWRLGWEKIVHRVPKWKRA